jgi:N-acetyl sugar amidotransferase
MSVIQNCERCIIDSTIPGTSFDENGFCNFCQDYDKHISDYTFTDEEEENNLIELFTKVKKSKNKKGYDSIIGLSGGVDSSYIALLAKKYGLNPLCIHFDNGWNSELAVSNIHSIISKYGFDLKTYVIDWEEFRDLQRSFLKAGVVDLELLSDHAIFASMYKIRKEFNIKYILSGTNYVTEHGMPMEWIWHKTDLTNIKSIQKKFGQIKINSFPTINSYKWVLSRKLGLFGEFIEPLNLMNFNKTKAIKELEDQIGWRSYGEKHQESIITRFYQGYILPKKFNIDKRVIHYSALIRSNELSKEDALVSIKKSPYDESLLNSDKEYVCKKLGFSIGEFDELMQRKPIPHLDYGSDRKVFDFLSKIYKKISK